MSTIHDADDPRLTAYALGELDDAECAVVEAFLETSAEGRRAVAEIRALAGELEGELRDELAGEESPALDESRRQAIAEAARSGAASATLRRLRPWQAAAAVFVVAVLLYEIADWSQTEADRSPRNDAGATREVATAPGGVGAGWDAGTPSRPQALGYLGGSGEAPAPARPESEVEAKLMRELAQLGYVGGSAAEAPAGAPPAVRAQGALGPGNSAGGTIVAETPAQDGGDASSGAGRAGTPAGKRGWGAILPQGGPEISNMVDRAAAGSDAQGRGAAGQAMVLYMAKADADGRAAGGSRDEAGTWRPRPTPTPGGEGYAPIVENPFVPLTADPLSALSTFGVDVDTASYANVRRFLTRNQAPPRDAVRLEELINAFTYAYPQPEGPHPFAVDVEVAACPWAPEHRLVRIGLQGRAVPMAERPPSNLVFLLDVSGSMSSSDKLPLLVASMKLLLGELDERDRVALVTYASDSSLVLPSTPASERATIEAALDGLSAGGSTHASAGLQQAYAVAAEHFLPEGTNRVLLATDGDFNVGLTDHDELLRFIQDKAKSGVFLTVLGFGTGNLKDDTAELLADKGNGQYAYIDTLDEAHRVLVEQAGGTLVTIAKDVKVQVEFNPGQVAAWRQLGYENRALAATDFRDDRKDAGEIGAGHSVTALYEVVPVGAGGAPGTVELKYQQAPPPPERLVDSDELLTVNLRYKQPDGEEATELAVPVVDGEGGFAGASDDFRFAAAVAAFGMVLRGSDHAGTADLPAIEQWAQAARGPDPEGRRAELVRLVRMAEGIPGIGAGGSSR